MPKISALPANGATPDAEDLFPFLDVSAGRTESVRYDQMATGGGGGTTVIDGGTAVSPFGGTTPIDGGVA